MLGTDEPFTYFGDIKIVWYFYQMRTTLIVINYPRGGALINCVYLSTLKSVDNASSFLRGPTKSCSEFNMVTEQ